MADGRDGRPPRKPKVRYKAGSTGSEIVNIPRVAPKRAEASGGDGVTNPTDAPDVDPRVPIEEWVWEFPFDSAAYLRRRGPWPKWTPKKSANSGR